MCRNYIYWATEFLNYWSLCFWGLKLFSEKYEIQLNKRTRTRNIIFIMASALIAGICAGNCKYVRYSNVVTYAFVIYVYFLLKIFTKGTVKKLFSLTVIYTNTMRLIDLWIVAVITEVNRVSRYVSLDLIYMGIARSFFMVGLALIYYLVYRLLSKSCIFEYLYENWFYRWEMCIYSFLGIICFCRVYRFEYNDQLIQYWILYLVCAFIVGGIFLFYVISVKGREKERMLNMRNDLMESNYSTLQKTYAENQMLYHDYKNHMLSVRQLIKEYRREDALEYIDAYISLTAKVNRRINSGSKILDIIVNSKLGEAKAKNIDFTCDVGYVGDTGITDIDMCALVANLLDNAIEACERMEHGERWISVYMQKQQHMFFIEVANSIDKMPVMKHGQFLTEKGDRELHGYGIKSIRRIVDKYDGTVAFQIENKTFKVEISFFK